MDKANFTKVRCKCKKVNFIAQLLTKMHTSRQFSIWFQTLLCKWIPKRYFSAKKKSKNGYTIQFIKKWKH